MMVQKTRFAIVLCVMVMAVHTVKAQCRDLDTQKLAELLVKEKKAGTLNDSLFTDFFRCCGLQYGELPNGHGKRGYHKQYSYLDEPYTMTITMRTRKTDDGKLHRSISITVGEHGTWWWMILKLQAFGMKKEGGGEDWQHADLKGKGLFCGTGVNSLTIGY